MIPVVVLGTTVALEVAQTGILLTLAFDLMLACLVVPFLLGLFWTRGGTRAAVAAMTVGLAVRVTLFVLTPTMYGVPNDVLYIPNGLVDATLRRLADDLRRRSPRSSPYLVAAAVWPRTVVEEAWAIADGDLALGVACRRRQRAGRGRRAVRPEPRRPRRPPRPSAGPRRPAAVVAPRTTPAGRCP